MNYGIDGNEVSLWIEACNAQVAYQGHCNSSPIISPLLAVLMEFISAFNASVSVFHNDDQNGLTVVHIDRRPFTHIFVSCPSIPFSSMSWTRTGIWSKVTVRISLFPKVHLFAINVIRPPCRMTNMCPYSIGSVCEFFSILACLNFSFPFFRKNRFLSLCPIFFAFEALEDFQISNFSLVRSFFMLTWWLILISLDKSVTGFLFSLLD